MVLRRVVLALSTCAVGAGFLAACEPTPYIVHQSTLAPMPAVVLPPSFEGAAELTLGDSTVLYLQQPQLIPNAGAALYTPRTQIDGSLSIGTWRRVRIRLPYLIAPSSGAMAAAPASLSAPDAPAWGLGGGVAVRLGGFGEAWNLDLLADISALSIPTLMRDGNNPSTDRVRRSAAPQLAITVAPGYVLSRGVRTFMVATVRNQVSNVSEFVTTDFNPSPEVTASNFYVAFGVGAELSPARWVSFTPLLQWPLGGSPVNYGPVLSINVRMSVPVESGGSNRPTQNVGASR